MQSKKPFPKPLPLKKLIGPSFIILALGLGSGEVILWPYLASNYGLGIAWGALLGISFQFFMNMEIERYGIVKGESVFVGLAKMWKGSPMWFIFSTFIGFGLPGIIAASAQVFASLLGFESHSLLAIFMLIGIGIFLSIGKTVYGMMEWITTRIIFICVPFILILALYLATQADWTALFQGLLGHGEGYRWLPQGIPFAAFFAAFAYSGAGGNLNLTQSIYVKEKGYGMGVYAERISGLFQNKGGHKHIKLEGHDFALTKENLSRFDIWWRRINIEHGLVFWFLGASAMMLLMLLSYVLTYGNGNATNLEGIQFVMNQGTILSSLLSPIVGTLFLVAVTVMLFQTQLGVLDSTSRIMAENAALRSIHKHKKTTINLSRYYFTFLWAQIAFGILLFLFGISEPKVLIILGAVINAFAMFVHIGLVQLLNRTTLPKQVQPGLFRKTIMLLIFLVFAVFSAYTIYSQIITRFL